MSKSEAELIKLTLHMLPQYEYEYTDELYRRMAESKLIKFCEVIDSLVEEEK